MKIFLLSIIYVFLGCSSLGKDSTTTKSALVPPKMELPLNKDLKSVTLYLEQKKNALDANQATKIWVDYITAQLLVNDDSTKSCQLFRNLASNEDFPLKELSYLRSLEICELDLEVENQLEKIAQIKNKPWLQDIKMEVQLKLAHNAKDPNMLIDAYWEKSKLPLPRGEKVDYALKALELAKKNKFSKKTRELQKRVYKLAPRYKPRPNLNEYLQVAYDYRRVRNFKKAHYYYNKVITHRRASFSTKLMALQGIAKSYKLVGDKSNHLKYVKKAADHVYTKYKKRPKNKNNLELLTDINLKLARTYWTQGKIKLAQKTLRSLSQRVKGKYSRDKIFWIFGRMAEEKQDFKAAIWWFDQALKEDFRSAEFKEVVLWYKTWNLRKIGQFNESAKILKDLVVSTHNTFNKPKYLYWLAKNNEALEKFEDARTVYTDLIEEDPMGYYGLLAHRETQELVKLKGNNRSLASPLSPTEVTTFDMSLLHEIVDVNYLEWLISVGENNLAKLFLDQAASQYRKSEDKNGTEQDNMIWVALFHYYAKAGDYLSLFAQLGKLDSGRRNEILAANPELIFPKPYLDHVSESANRFGISSEYIYSIMRQESAFNPRARSHMDAFGLMQLLPKVAKKSALENNIPFSTAEDLYKPHISISLGAAHLRQLWDHYGGKIILATASYNANEKAIKGWLKTRYRGDPLEFIEDIPYEETRNYIKLVLRNLVFYQMFNSSKEAVSFPEWALNLDS